MPDELEVLLLNEQDHLGPIFYMLIKNKIKILKKEKPEKKEGFIKRLRARINRGDSWLTYDLANLAPGGKIDDDTLEELEKRFGRR